MDATHFEPLVNDKGLVLMRTAFAWAPYEENALYGFPPERAAELFNNHAAYPVDPKTLKPIPVMGQVIEVIREPPASAKVIIPDEWERMHRLQMTQLAKQIRGNPDQSMSEAEAREVIAAELKRRSEEDAVQV